MVPLNIRFDGAANVQGSNVVRMPKLNQGAPYSFSIRVRNEDTTYRDFSEVEKIRWRIKLAPKDTADFMMLTLENGNFEVTTASSTGDTLAFKIAALDWAGIEVPLSNNHMEMDVPFSFVVEFLDSDSVVVERFAQGTGLISVAMATTSVGL